MRRTEVIVENAQEVVMSQLTLWPVTDSLEELVNAVLHCDIVPTRPTEAPAARRLVMAMVDAMGSNADTLLSGYLSTTKARLVQLVTREASKAVRSLPPQEVVHVQKFAPVRQTKPDVSTDRHGSFIRSIAYAGWSISLYEQAWFDSSPERDMANVLDESPDIVAWTRLHRGDLPILWTGQGSFYNPDFIAIGASGVHWIVEVKQDRLMPSDEVNDKMQAAQRWANRATDSPEIGAIWKYLLVSEMVLAQSRESWQNVLALGQK